MTGSHHVKYKNSHQACIIPLDSECYNFPIYPAWQLGHHLKHMTSNHLNVKNGELAWTITYLYLYLRQTALSARTSDDGSPNMNHEPYLSSTRNTTRSVSPAGMPPPVALYAQRATYSPAIWWQVLDCTTEMRYPCFLCLHNKDFPDWQGIVYGFLMITFVVLAFPSY